MSGAYVLFPQGQDSHPNHNWTSPRGQMQDAAHLMNRQDFCLYHFKKMTYIKNKLIR